MKTPILSGIFAFVQLIIAPPSVPAQALLVARAGDETVDVGRPRVATAADGSFAVAWDALRIAEGSEVKGIAVQRYSADEALVGATNFFEPEIGCDDFDIWTRNYLQHAEIAFLPSGELLVLMNHAGLFNLAGQDAALNSETTLGIIGNDGEFIDADGQADCLQMKLIFGTSPAEDERPRLAVTSGGIPFFTADGFFHDDQSYGEVRWRNSPVSLVDLEDLRRIIEFVPHDDPASRTSFHAFPDIAIGGDLVLSVWHECPVIDDEGNANECDIGAQFYAIGDAGLNAMGGNQRVNGGDAVGTLNFQPSAAINAAGESVIVWLDLRSAASGDVYGQRYDAGGNFVGENFRVTTGEGIVTGSLPDGQQFAERPEVALLDDGRFMVVWTEIIDGTIRARGRRFDTGGTPEGAPFDLAGATDLQTLYPDVAAHREGFMSVWTGFSASGSSAVFRSEVGRVVDIDKKGPATGASLDATAHPNPARGSAQIRYELPGARHVTIAVYDLLGREVAAVLDEYRSAGRHSVEFEAEALPAGPYFVAIAAGSLRQTLPLSIVR